MARSKLLCKSICVLAQVKRCAAHCLGYESGFESHAFAGELEIAELPEYFRECDLYPVQSDIDEAFDIVFRGNGFDARVVAASSTIYRINPIVN